MTPERIAELRRWADSDLTEALDEIERLDSAVRRYIGFARRHESAVADMREDRERFRATSVELARRVNELERELADTRRDVRDLQAELNRRP